MGARRMSCLSLLAAWWIAMSGAVGHAGGQARTPRPRVWAESTWVRLGGPPGGLGYDIRYNFGNHDLWYVTDAWAGLHMSSDHGLTWYVSNSGVTTRVRTGAADAIPVFCATVDPHDPDIVWIGTQNSGDLFKSTDGGATWVKKVEGIDGKIVPFLSFRGVTVDPRSSDIVYAMGEIGSPGWTPDGSARNGLELDMTMGVVYRSTDGGEHWSEIWRGNNLARYCWIDPRDPNVLYVSTGIFDREAANTDVATGFAGGVGILKSNDGGTTWRTLNQSNGLLDLFVGSLFMDPTDPDTLIAAASQNDWSGHGATFTGGVFITNDGGEQWSRVLTGELFSAVEICTCDPEVWYAASPKAVYRSDDAGTTWQRFSRSDNRWGPKGIIAGFPIDLQCDPEDPLTIFVNNYLGGNFVSTDGGETWSSASKGYTGAMVRQVAVAQGGTGRVYAGGRAGVFRSDDRGVTWSGLAYPPAEAAAFALNEITALAVDPTDENQLLTAPSDLGNLVYSSDGGSSWHVSTGLPGMPAALVFAPSGGDVVYASVGAPACPSPLGAPESCDETGADLFVSTNGGATWASARASSALDRVILTLAVDPRDSKVVWAGTCKDGVIKTADGGLTWTPSGTGLAALPVRTVVAGPGDPPVLYAALVAGLYRSSDGGQTWTPLSAGLSPESEIRSIAVDPIDGRVVYISDWFSGVYASSDGGGTWQAINRGLVHRTVNALALSPDRSALYAAIEGDGVYRLDAPRRALP